MTREMEYMCGQIGWPTHAATPHNGKRHELWGPFDHDVPPDAKPYPCYGVEVWTLRDSLGSRSFPAGCTVEFYHDDWKLFSATATGAAGGKLEIDESSYSILRKTG